MSTPSKARRLRGEGAVYEEPESGRWIGKLDLGRGPDGRRRQRKVTGRSKSEVSRRLRELRKQAIVGVDVARRSPTLEQVINEWFEKTAVERKSEATLARLRRRLDQEAVAGQAKATVQQYRGDLRQILKWAVARDLVPRNVADAAHVPHTARAATEKRAFTWDELDALYDALEEDRLGPYFTVLAELGLRNQEADALAWSDVSIDDRRAQIRRAMKRGDGGTAIGIGSLKVALT